MFSNLFRGLFRSRNQRIIRRHRRMAVRIGKEEENLRALSPEELRARAAQCRDRLRTDASQAEMLPEVFALVREASSRTLGLRHFDVQLIGGMVLHEGGIAEMRTGEGKTLVATLPASLRALAGESVHIVTVNDYLARRDAEWMRPIYEALGLTVGVIVQNLDGEERRAAYAADIIYGTNNEFGFDYLRDNMVFRSDQRVQRSLDFAVVDEVDSILIDEARTPLIISGPEEDDSDLYRRMDVLVQELKPQEEEDGPGDFRLDEKSSQVSLSEEGHHHMEQVLIREELITNTENLYETSNISLMHHINVALRARWLFQRDRHYIVSPERKIVIIDEFTGRKSPGRRWGQGLHQAIEAKEGVPVDPENHTVASITFQNYFRLYGSLSGMTGTADTEAYEFQEIYGLEVVVVPTHKLMIREDMGDQIFLTAQEKILAVLEDIEDCVERGQPVLVGTTSIASSENFSRQLKDAGISHEVLNAKQHERESHIIAQAGRPKAVTIATNMAGRGTDIVLGGAAEEVPEDADATEVARAEAEWQVRHEQVKKAGGLHIIGTERHESRRIDNQLRGRSGRQGDPGSSRFYLSMEDNLIRIFARDRIAGMMQKLGLEEGECIEHPWVTRSIGTAQRKVEAHNFDIRKQLLEYDDVNNEQRKVVYGQRRKIMDAEEVDAQAREVCGDAIERIMRTHLAQRDRQLEWNPQEVEQVLQERFNLSVPVAEWLEERPEPDVEECIVRLRKLVNERIDEKAKQMSPGFEHLQKDLLLSTLDGHWREHLRRMEYLREGIGLRGYAQKNPKQEYKREAFALFQDMLDQIETSYAILLCRLQPQTEETRERPRKDPARSRHESSSAPIRKPAAASVLQAPRSVSSPPRKVGRNAPCPCGSGKKYKHCCGAAQTGRP